jgi:hypothetical protein
MRFARPLFVATTIVLAGCDHVPTAPEPEAAVNSHFAGHTALAVGAGRFAIGELSVRYAFSGVRLGSHAFGSFFHSVDLGEGEKAEFVSKVTCLAFDPVNRRAWFGGVILRNNSTANSGFTAAIHQTGRDIWFRILDTGSSSSEPDRSTFVGFEGSAGIITSAEYCQVKTWPDANARTNPVTQGEIRITAH